MRHDEQIEILVERLVNSVLDTMYDYGYDIEELDPMDRDEVIEALAGACKEFGGEAYELGYDDASEEQRDD